MKSHHNLKWYVKHSKSVCNRGKSINPTQIYLVPSMGIDLVKVTSPLSPNSGSGFQAMLFQLPIA